MLSEIATSFRQTRGSGLRRRVGLVYLFLISLNVFAWTLALVVFHSYPATLSLCFLAYGLGLRHAVDADHIAAIDNVTRKLMQEKKQPVAVGFFFSLGHSTIVVLMSLAVALGTGYVKQHFPEFQKLGGIIGTSISAFFLLLIATINFFIFLEVFRRFQAARRGHPIEDDSLSDMLAGPGRIAGLLRGLFRLVTESWHMYFVGFLFGLGFDTATEIALLGIAGTQAVQQASIWSIMVFPLLFTSGMCLLDTTDGIVMLGAYGWAFVKPVRKLFYNMTITLVSFLIALVIGSLEALNVLASKLGLDTGVWAYVNVLGENSTIVGYGIIGLMIAAWVASMVVYRVARFDELDE
jgi:nickel/cobalt transporter (NiCoT) family protein